MSDLVTINIGKDFNRYPVGRYRADGDANGERFREDFVRPQLVAGRNLRIELDDALGYGSSFLEEVFGGLVRNGYTAARLESLIELVTTDDSLLAEIKGYMAEANT